ncbi:MAG: nucleoside-diphosphate kinase [Candidatus Riflemargulisbacteria bacterium]
MERTLVLIKPDAVKRRVVANILDMFESHTELEIKQLKLMTLTYEKAYEHYGEHEGKPFFEDLMQFITSGPLYAIEIIGDNAISDVRKLCGSTNPLEAAPGTIRARYATATNRNVVHSSDSPENAKRELNVFFG